MKKSSTKKTPKKPDFTEQSLPCKVNLSGLRFTGWQADLTLYHNHQEHRATVTFGDDTPTAIDFDKEGYDLHDKEERESAQQNEDDLREEFQNNAADLHFLMPLRLNDEAKNELKELLDKTNIFGSLSGEEQEWWSEKSRRAKLVAAQLKYISSMERSITGLREWRVFKGRVYATKTIAALQAVIEKEKGKKK